MSYKCTHCKDNGWLPMFMPGSTVPCDWCQGPQANAETEPEPAEDYEISSFDVDGEIIEIGRVTQHGHGGVEVTEMGCSRTWMLFPDSDTAGTAARDYYAELAQSDPEYFRTLVGSDTLSRWALGQSAGPGSAQVCSLSDWLDLYLSRPEEHFANYDGTECEIESDSVTAEGIEEIGFTPGVAYRTN
jgi:hypothetical protein